MKLYRVTCNEGGHRGGAAMKRKLDEGSIDRHITDMRDERSEAEKLAEGGTVTHYPGRFPWSVLWSAYLWARLARLWWVWSMQRLGGAIGTLAIYLTAEQIRMDREGGATPEHLKDAQWQLLEITGKTMTLYHNAAKTRGRISHVWAWLWKGGIR